MWLLAESAFLNRHVFVGYEGFSEGTQGGISGENDTGTQDKVRFMEDGFADTG
jgi:hypothetical protein